MSQVLHILQKDLRHLWPQIAVVWSLVTLFSWTEATRSSLMLLMRPQPSEVLTILAPLAMWYLVSAAVHGESLVGDRQYWVTRPIVWNRLLAAKGLFIVTMVQLPLAIADCCVLAAQGFSPSHYLPSVLWRQASIAVAWILPAAVFSAITKNLAQLALAGFALLALALTTEPLLRMGQVQRFGGPFQWIQSSAFGLVVIAVAAFVLVTQYTQRRTGVSRTVTGAVLSVSVLFFVFAPWEWDFALQSSLSTKRVSDELAQVSFVPDAPAPEPAATTITVRPENTARIPLRISGLPDKHEVVVNRISVRARTTEGLTRPVQGGLRLRRYDENGIYWHSFLAGESWPEGVLYETVSLEVSLFLTLYGNPKETRSAAMDDPSVMPDGSLCTPDPAAVPGALYLSCRSPLRAPTQTSVRLYHRSTGDSRSGGFGRRGPIVPFSTVADLSAISRAFVMFPLQDDGKLGGDPWKVTPEECDVVFETWEPLGHFRRTCRIPAIRLADYIADSIE